MSERKPAESRRLEIADATLKVIAEHGLARFTAQAIAGEVGLSDAALFRHFESKEAMVEAAIERAERILFEGFPPDAADPLERLGRFFRQRAGIARRNPGVARLVLCEELAQAAAPAGVARVRELRRRSVRFVRACLAEARARGLLAPGLDAKVAEVVVVGALLALGHARRPAGGPGDGAVERTWAVIARVLGGAPSARRPPATSVDVSRRPRRRRGKAKEADT
jgi:AcrR family transcriptional regulator